MMFGDINICCDGFLCLFIVIVGELIKECIMCVSGFCIIEIFFGQCVEIQV